VIAARNIIITAANDLYLPLALGLLRSLRRLHFSSSFDIGVLDVGLSDDAKTQISAFGATIVPARVDIDYPDRLAWEQQAPAFRSLTARPYFRDYFPGYDVYMLVDADAWAQTPEAIDTMLAGAGADNALYIAAEIDRDYSPYFLSSQPWEYQLNWYRANFPPETVAAIFPRPMLNAGVWAMRASSPVWKAWGDVYTACLQRFAKMTKQQFMCDQLSLNIAVYTQGLPLKIMPAEFNWLSLYAIPMIDTDTGLFVRPTPPRTPISILHLTHEKKFRSFDLATTTGGTVTRSLMNEA
jgi:lipopolysaccharide biosynthesis glycosyltransferase